MKALGISERLGLARFQSLQAYYTIAGRDLEREMVPMLQSRRARPDGLEPARRRLAERQVRPRPGRPRRARRTTFDFPPVDKERAFDCIDVMREIAAARACRWRRSRWRGCCISRAVTSVIIGAKKPEQLADNIGATALALTGDELARLGEVGGLPAEYPGWMLARQGEVRVKQLAGARRAG